MSTIYTSAEQLIGNTPLVELTQIEKELDLKAKLIAKLELFNPAGSVKDRVALAMINDAEKRGVLYCRIVPPMTGKAIHVMCVQLGLREAHRQAQLAMLAEWVNELPDGEPVLVAGDFNDWRQKANHPLKVQAGLDEIFTRAHGRPARTFPVQFPLLRLDRIYVKNASASAPTALPLRTWRHLSDHAPLSAEIHL